jgi:hypothetical protein
MCNPRRLVVNLTQQIEEEWHATATETATARVAVSERLERVIPLGGRLGPSARLGLAAALAEGFRGWRRVEGEESRFACEIGPLRLSLDTGTAELVVTAERRRSVSGKGSAEEGYDATIRGTVEVEKKAIAYEDGWGGRSVEVVQRELDDEARVAAAGKRQSLIEEQSREAREDARSRATASARHRAEKQAEALGEEERKLLRQELEELFQQSRSVLHEEIAALVGETLRRSVLHLVKVNGGELRQCQETDDAIVIEAVL